MSISPFAGMGQNIAQTYQLAKSYQEAGHYDAAIETYMRVIFFDEEEQFIKESLFNTANLHFLKGNYSEAALFYQRVSNYFPETQRDQIYLQIISSYLLAQQYDYALQDLLEFEPESIENMAQKRQILLQYASAYYGKRDYDKSFSYFDAWLKQEGVQASTELGRIQKKLLRVEKKKESTAYYLSAFIPGFGQLYAHDYRNALNSFVLAGGLAILGIYTGFTYGFGDAILVVLPWWSRYYIGGLNGAEKSLQRYKAKKRHSYFNAILDLSPSNP